MNRKVTICGMHGNDWCDSHVDELRTHIQSWKNLADCDHVVITNEMPEWLIQEITSQDGRIIKRPKVVDNFFDTVHANAFSRDCMEAAYAFFKAEPEGRTYIHTCSRDVIFQTDIPQMDGLHVVYEGMRYRDCGWSSTDVFYFRGRWSELENEKVINGGQFAGSKARMLELYELFLSCSFKETGSCQVRLNWAIHREGFEATIHEPETSDFCLSGWATVHGFKVRRNEEGKVINLQGKPFKFIHGHADRFLEPRKETISENPTLILGQNMLWDLK